MNRGEHVDLSTGECFYVKSPVFPWGKFPGVDTVLGPEMRSTGEVMGVADNFGEAFAKAQLAAGHMLPSRGTRLHQRERPRQAGSGGRGAAIRRSWLQASWPRTVPPRCWKQAGIHVERVYKVKEGRPNVVDLIKGGRIQLIINTPHGVEPWFDEKAIRRAAITARIPTITTLSAARAAAEGIAALQRGEVSVRDLQALHAEREPPSEWRRPCPAVGELCFPPRRRDNPRAGTAFAGNE